MGQQSNCSYVNSTGQLVQRLCGSDECCDASSYTCSGQACHTTEVPVSSDGLALNTYLFWVILASSAICTVLALLASYAICRYRKPMCADADAARERFVREHILDANVIMSHGIDLNYPPFSSSPITTTTNTTTTNTTDSTASTTISNTTTATTSCSAPAATKITSGTTSTTTTTSSTCTCTTTNNVRSPSSSLEDDMSPPSHHDSGCMLLTGNPSRTKPGPTRPSRIPVKKPTSRLFIGAGTATRASIALSVGARARAVVPPVPRPGHRVTVGSTAGVVPSSSDSNPPSQNVFDGRPAAGGGVRNDVARKSDSHRRGLAVVTPRVIKLEQDTDRTLSKQTTVSVSSSADHNLTAVGT